jgi:hypothetical protein
MSRFLLLPDTNIFLHFPALADVDWCGIIGADEVVIVIAPVITRELNDHKDNPRSRKLRDRADAALKDFHSRFKGQKPKELRPKVEIRFLSKDPAIDFTTHGLLQELPDDWLIATAIELKTQHSDEVVAIVSADFGLEVKASTHVRVVDMPESLRLPEELNSDEKKIKDLERQLRSIQAASPDIRLTFAGGGTFQDLQFYKFPKEVNVASHLDEAKKQYPKLREKTSSNLLGVDLSPFGNQLIHDYNERVDAYLKGLESYWNAMIDSARWLNDTAKVQLQVNNRGGAPAEDIDIFLHFPDGFEVVDEEGLPKAPKEPSPPQNIQEALNSFANPLLVSQPSMAQLNSLIPRAEGNTRLLGIKKTKSHEVKFHVKRLKHHTHVQLPKIYLHFDEERKSFGTEYRLIAGNVPTPVTGTLDFIFRQESS